MKYRFGWLKIHATMMKKIKLNFFFQNNLWRRGFLSVNNRNHFGPIFIMPSTGVDAYILFISATSNSASANNWMDNNNH